MKKTILATMTAAMILSSSLTAFAAPETMPDGTIFDAEYYAQTNPDVVAILGTDKNSLYQHYLNYGKAEGRQAYEVQSNSILAQTNLQQQQWIDNLYNALITNDKKLFSELLRDREYILTQCNNQKINEIAYANGLIRNVYAMKTTSDKNLVVVDDLYSDSLNYSFSINACENIEDAYMWATPRGNDIRVVTYNSDILGGYYQGKWW